MSIGFTKIYNGVNVVPQNTTAPSVNGDIRFNSTFGYFEVFVSTGLDQITTNAATQTLTNKTLTGNTASNLINAAGTLTLNTSGNVTIPNVVSTDTLVALAATQTLSNKTLSDSLTLAQIATPSNPASGFNKIYAKSDSNLYILTSAGAESKVGVGSVTSIGMSVPAFLTVTPSTITSSGTFAVTYSGTALPIANGGTGVTAATTTPTPAAFVGWDANSNLQANAFIPGAATTATAGGTTVLTVASKQVQQFTGTLSQTVTLPDATTLLVGQTLIVTNRSLGNITVNKNGGGLLQVLQTGANGSQATFTLINNVSANGVWDVQYTNTGFVVGIQPTISKFTSGSGTYTVPAGVQYLRVRMVGGGGGGAGSGTTTGTVATSGGNTTFGTSLLTANGGGNGIFGNNPNPAGTATIGTGAFGTALSGATGGGVSGNATAATTGPAGGGGGSSAFGGAGGGGTVTLGGQSAAVNTGSGGGGAGAGNQASNFSGSGGSSGGYVDAIITSPATSYTFAVGTAGAAGGAGAGTGTTAGGAGGSGYIEVTEYYSNVSVGSTATVAAIQPTIQKFTTGSSLTYTTPVGVQYIKVRISGGGGGGSGSGTGGNAGNGGAGNTTTFGPLTATGGGAGAQSGPIPGGSGTISLPAFGTILQGGQGSGGANNAATVNTSIMGGPGGANPFGGMGGGGNYITGSGGNAAANTGAGGGGGGNAAGQGVTVAGTGGGAGGYVEAIITSPASTYTYTIGTGGAAGNAGSAGFAGGVGAAGIIIVEEYYSNFSVGTSTSVAANTVLAGPQSGTAAGPTFRTLTLADLPVKPAAVYQVGTTASNTGGLPCNFDTKVLDTLNNVTTGAGTWIFRASVAGNYVVSVGILQNSNQTPSFSKNGVSFVQTSEIFTGAVSNTGSFIIPLAVNDYIQFVLQTTVMVTAGTYSNINIYMI